MGKYNSHDTEYLQLRQRILSFICDPDFHPAKTSKLLRAAEIPDEQRQRAEEVLNDLVRDGTLVNLKHKGLALAEAVDLMSGAITFIRGGAAFVNSLDGRTSVYIPSAETGTALPSDRVLVRISRKTKADGHSTREGTVIRVSKRNCVQVVGTLSRSRRVYHVTPMQSTMTHNVIVADPAGAEEGDRVLVKLAEWEDPSLPPEGDIVEVLGAADNPQLDTLAVIKAFNLPEEFPPEVIAEAEHAGFDESDCIKRTDLRDSFIFTIDPKTARDYDDAISLEKVDGGLWELGVHIADVSHFVQPGSALDREAIRRGTSVYLPDKVIPMLPVQLSNGLCSLNPNKDRLAFSIFMTLDAEARVVSSRFADSVMHSKLRLTYHQALTALNSAGGATFPEWSMDEDVVNKIKQCGEYASAIRKRRMNEGALHIDLPQSQINIGKDGRISSIDAVVSDPAHQLIEEFMVLANETVSRAVSDRGLPQVFRVHEEPDPEKLAELEMMFIEAGLRPGNLTNHEELSALLHEISDAPQAHVWYMRVLRSLKRAIYSTEGLGHFGLAKEFYCHFTSPIRRYPDLIMHRLMKALIHDGKIPYDKRELTELSFQCSELESRAVEAEREVLDQKRMRYFQEQIDSGKLIEFEAIVTEIRNFGMSVEIPSAQSFGMIHLSYLTQDFFDHIKETNEIRGRKTRISYKVGSRLKVVIVRVDERKRFLDFAPAGLAPDGVAVKPRKVIGPRVNASGMDANVGKKAPSKRGSGTPNRGKSSEGKKKGSGKKHPSRKGRRRSK